MIKFIKYSFLLFVSFVVSFELLSTFSINSNALYVEDKKPTSFSNTNQESVYFIGDSYAKTDYVNEGYPILFQKYFDSNGMNFVDLSNNGSELDTHKKLLDSLSVLNPKLIIYFYNIGDVIGLEESASVLGNESVKISTNKTNEDDKYYKRFGDLIYQKSKSLELLKDVVQFSYLTFTDKAAPGSDIHEFPILNKKHGNKIQELFNSINSEYAIILITTPFNCGIKPKKWEHYNLFKNMELKSNIHLIQSVDIINKPGSGVSWRNAHPNQEAIKIVADSIFQLYTNNKD